MQLLLPKELLNSLQGCPGFDEEAFVRVHQSGEQITSLRYNPMKRSRAESLDGPSDDQKVPWSSQGVYLSVRPSFTMDPAFHGGAYYVQEASGMFLEQALRQTVDLSEPLRILDLCAAPGGKSTLIQSLISKDSLLVSNEVIRSRINVVRENLVKWGAANVFVTNNDPVAFSALENYFDVILVDAPCSGSGLFRREPASIAQWSESAVQQCSLRQERILADIWPALKQNGILIYATCSYSKKENEDILDWLMSSFDARSIKLNLDPGWGISEVVSDQYQAYGYRFYPDQIKGEGFFLGCLIKKDGGIFSYPVRRKAIPDNLNRNEESVLNFWIEPGCSLAYFKREDLVHALPAVLLRDVILMQSFTYLKKAGILAGKLGGGELIPDHELALSLIVNRKIPSFQLSQEEAILYLRKEDLKMDPDGKGWALVKYGDLAIGWVKVLEKRVNNYYPKDWRITKKE